MKNWPEPRVPLKPWDAERCALLNRIRDLERKAGPTRKPWYWHAVYVAVCALTVIGAAGVLGVAAGVFFAGCRSIKP
jgi:hypothetical protein